MRAETTMGMESGILMTNIAHPSDHRVKSSGDFGRSTTRLGDCRMLPLLFGQASCFNVHLTT